MILLKGVDERGAKGGAAHVGVMEVVPDINIASCGTPFCMHAGLWSPYMCKLSPIR